MGVERYTKELQWGVEFRLFAYGVTPETAQNTLTWLWAQQQLPGGFTLDYAFVRAAGYELVMADFEGHSEASREKILGAFNDEYDTYRWRAIPATLVLVKNGTVSTPEEAYAHLRRSTIILRERIVAAIADANIWPVIFNPLSI